MIKLQHVWNMVHRQKDVFWWFPRLSPAKKPGDSPVRYDATIIIQRVTCLSDPEVRSCGAVEAGMAHATTGAVVLFWHARFNLVAKSMGNPWETPWENMGIFLSKWFFLSKSPSKSGISNCRLWWPQCKWFFTGQTIHLILQKNSLHMRRQTWTHAPPFNHLFLNVMYIVFFRKPTPGVWMVMYQGTRSDVDRHLRFETWPIGPMWPPFLLGSDANFKNLHDWFKKKTSHMI